MFGHDPLSWTPIRGLGAETKDGMHHFGIFGLFEDDDDDNGGFFDDLGDTIGDTVGNLIPDELVDKVKQTFQEVKGAVTKAYVYATGEDVAISQTEVIWCCGNGTQKKVVYGLYKVDSKKSARGGPRTVDGITYSKNEKYAKLQYWESSGPYYNGGFQRMTWNSKPGIARFKVGSLSDVPAGARWDAETRVFGVAATQAVATVLANTGEDTGGEQLLPLTAQDMFDKFVGEVDMQGPCDSEPNRGCMNSIADNYKSSATCSDGSCKCGNDMSGNRKKFNNTGTECIVTQCTDANRKKNSDGSCATSCNDGFVFKKGVYPKVCVPAPIDCVVGKWSAWSSCSADGNQTRSRSITTQAQHDGKTCKAVAGTAYLKGSMEREPVALSGTRTCTPPTIPAEDGDDDTDITTLTTTTTAVVQEEKKSMMPWIIGGAVVLGVGVFAMKK